MPPSAARRGGNGAPKRSDSRTTLASSRPIAAPTAVRDEAAEEAEAAEGEEEEAEAEVGETDEPEAPTE